MNVSLPSKPEGQARGIRMASRPPAAPGSSHFPAGIP
jgi:hypothetical protein